MRRARILVLSTVTLALTTLGATGADALVVAGNDIFWITPSATSDATGRAAGIGRARTDGSRVQRTFVRNVRATSIAVNSTHLYWSTGDRRKTGAIGRVRRDGKRPQRALLRQRAGAIAVDDRGLYWSGPRGIGRATLSGKRARNPLVPIRGRDWGVAAIAASSGYVFWSEGLESKAAWDRARESDTPTGRIGRADRDGRDADRSWITWHRAALMTSAADIVGVADGKVHWRTAFPDNKLERAAASGAEPIGRCEPVLSNCTTLLDIAEAGLNVNARFAVDGGYLYWASPVRRGTRIYRSPLNAEGVGVANATKPELIVSLPYEIR